MANIWNDSFLPNNGINIWNNPYPQGDLAVDYLGHIIDSIEEYLDSLDDPDKAPHIELALTSGNTKIVNLMCKIGVKKQLRAIENYQRSMNKVNENK